MRNDSFDQQIEAAHQRLETLVQRASGWPEQKSLMGEALEELSAALEELHVAGEELRQQNDELAASRQAVEAERQRYEELFEFAPDGYLVTDPEGVIQEANRAAAGLLGVRQDFLVGKPLLVFVADVTVGHAAFHTRLTQLQQAHSDKLQDWQLWLQPREGGPFLVEVTVGRVCDADGRLTGLRWLLRDITRRKRAEEALQLSEAHYRAIVEDQTEFTLRFLPDGSLTFVNGAYCRYLGEAHEEMIDRNLMLLMPTAAWQDVEKRLVSLTPENPATTYELHTALPGGQMGWQQWTTRALYDDGGNLVEYQSVGRDITDRKRAEEEIAYLAKFPSENPHPVLRLSQAGIVLYANEASQTLLQKWECAVGDSVPSYWRGLVAEAVASRATRTVDIECGERVYSLVVTPIAEAGYVNLYGQDITEHKRMEDALRESEARFRLALKNAPVSVAAQDRGLRFIWAYNQRTVRPADVIGKTDTDLFAPEDATRLMALKRKVLETGAEVREQLWLTSGGRRVFLDLFLEPIRDEAGQIAGVGIATVDMTERKRAEQERERLLAELDAEKVRWQATVENMLDPVTVADVHGQAIYMNAAYSCMVERTIRPDLDLEEHPEFYQLYRPDGSLFAPDELPLQKATLTGEAVRNVEIVQRDPRGGEHIAIWNAAPLRDAQDHVTGAVAVGRDVTELRQAEAERERLLEENRSQRQFLERLMEVAPVGIAVVHGPDHIYEFVNPYYHKIPGVPDLAKAGRSFAEVFPDVAQAGLNLLETVYRTGQTVSVREYGASVGPGRGNTFWDVDHVPLRAADGTVDGVLIVAHEVTGQVLARQQIEELALRDEAILDSMTEGLLISDLDGNVLSLNPAARRIHGHAMTEDMDQPYQQVAPAFELCYSDGRPMALEDWPLPRVLRGETLDNFETQLRRADSAQAKIVSYGGTLVRDKAGRAMLAIVTSRDMTAQRKVEADRLGLLDEVRRRAAELDATITSIADGVMIIDRDGMILRMNPAAEKIMGNSEAVRAMSLAERAALFELKTADGVPLSRLKDTPAQRALNGEIVRSFVLSAHVQDQPQQWLSTSAAPVQTADGRTLGAVVSLTDITELRQTQQRLQDSNEQLQSQTEELGVQTEELQVLTQELSRARDELELRVQERTAELTQANAFLQAEIVERKRAEQAVRIEQQRFNNVLEMLPAYLLLLTPDYHVSFANHYFRERFGESNGRRCYEYLFGRTEPCEVCETYNVLKTNTPLEWEWTGPDGRNYSVFDFPFIERDGSTLILEMGIDVTEQKRAEEALRLASAYNRSLIEASLDPLVTIGPDGKFTDVNLATEAATGCSRSELVGTDFADYFTEPDLARAGYREAFREGSVRDYALELLHRDGRVTSVLYNASVYRDESGHVIGVFAAARDITARKQAEAQLRLQSTALEAAANGIIITDRQGNIQWCNPAFTQMTGYTAEQVLGQNPRLLRSGQQTPEFYRQLWETILAGQVWRGAMTNKRRDGSLYIEEQTIAPVPNERGETTHFVAIKQDVTERKRMEEAERRARRIAETLSAANQALTQTLNLEMVMETLLDFVEQLIPYDSANVMLLETESRLAVRVTRGYERWGGVEQVRAITFDVQTNPILGELFTTRKSSLVSDSRALPGWERHPGAEHVRSWIGVPLVAGGNVIGVYSLDKAVPGFFTQEHVQLAEMLVGQAAVAIQNAWLFEQVRAGHERLQSLSRRLVEVQEAERRYVARELHDEAGQSLTLLVFGLGQLEQETDRSQHVARIAELKQTTNQVLEDLHRLAMDLRPASLDHLGLVVALAQYVKMTGDRYGLIAQFKALGFDDERLLPAKETALYRIVQEALTNVVRHAQATRVDVLLERRGDQVVVVIEDNGVGFDADMARFASSGRLGLLGMQERVEMLGGSLVIETAAGAGTTIVVEVPYGDSYSHRG